MQHGITESAANMPPPRAGYGLVAVVGFFALVAQTLLFRQFLTVFEGNELGIACFFGSWLAWVAVGAGLARTRAAATPALTRRFEFLPLLYLPAFLLQWVLIAHARELAGVQRYELFPIFTMLPVTFLACAPVSLCTGFLFTLGCRWLACRPGATVTRVFAWESAGSFAGGIAVTLLLTSGVPSEALFLVAALVLTLASAACGIARRAYVAAALPVLVTAAALLGGVAGRWEQYNDRHTWRRVLPDATLRGRFTTPEARYLYGEHNGQFTLVSWETVTDTIPAEEHASEIVALHLAQQPAARRFLVVGRGGFAVCRRLQTLPQADAITWLDPDPAYPAWLRRVLPPSLTTGTERIETPGIDAARWLRTTRATYDTIILNVPDATTLSLNRAVTREFLMLLKTRLTPTGILGVRVTAGENYMSAERANVGASVYHTLRTVFRHLAIKPGEESWMIASDGSGLTAAPATLRERFAAVPGAERIYPPAGLLSLYLPQRIEYQRECYERAGQGTGAGLLVNTEQRPRALLHALLFAAREAGGAGSWGDALRTFALRGAAVVPAGLVLFLLIRLIYRFAERRAPAAPPAPALPAHFDSAMLVFTTGAAGMGGCVVLMYVYQTAFGSIFLHAGLLSALYMLGLALGSASCQHVLTRRPGWLERALLCALGVNVGLYALAMGLGPHATRTTFAAAFVLLGLAGGAYVPVAVARLRADGMPADAAGARLEAFDHLGGAAGAIAMGLLLLPLFGTTYGLAVLMLLLLTNTASLWPRREAVTAHDQASAGAPPVRAAAYALFGLVVFALVTGHQLRRGSGEERRQAFLAFARASAGQAVLQAQRRTLNDGTTLDYFAAGDAASNTAAAARFYAFTTEALAPGIQGYGGTLALAVLTDAEGSLRRVAILPSRETPAYVRLLQPWLDRLAGHSLFRPDPLGDIDAVSGATLTSVAVLKILRQAGPEFARKGLGLECGPAAPAPVQRRAWGAGAWLAVTALAALLLRRHPSRRLRRGFLLLVVAGSGVWLNAQYSLQQAFALAGLALPPPGWTAAFLLAVGMPLLVAVFGNVYCGYLCPFGALQELVGDLRPRRLATAPDKAAWQPARRVKYGVLALLALLFGATLQPVLASGDLLVSVFARVPTRWVALAGVAALGLSFFYPRFWCRAVCPTGAFLALLNGLRIGRRLVPTVAPGACEYGVRHSGELDCLCCDRCRGAGAKGQSVPVPAAAPATGRQTAVAAGTRAPRLGMGLLAAALVLAGLTVLQSVIAWNRETEARRAAESRPGLGSARTVDMPRLQRLIEQGRLSGREALYYGPAPDAAPR